jgi:beta-galactosidase
MRLYRLFLLTGFFLAAVGSPRVLFAQRQHINFDKDWKFHLGHSSDPHRDFNYGIANILAKTGDAANTCIRTDFDDRGWETVQLPHDWAVSLPFAETDNKDEDLNGHGYHTLGAVFPENSIGWYRKTFRIDRADSGKRFVLQFDGVFRDSKVWINNCYLGGHFSGYSGASYDITDFLRYNAANTVVVRVDASQYEGWFYEGAGIYRHTWLNVYNNLHIAAEGGLFAHVQNATLFTNRRGDDNMPPDLDEPLRNADAGNTDSKNPPRVIEVDVKVENQGLGDAAATVQTFLTDRQGRVMVEAKAKAISPSEDKNVTVTQQLIIAHPIQWSLENPYLYRVVAVVRSGDKTVDSVATRIGIRTIAIDNNKGLSLNGQPIKIQGVCCHQDHAGVGSALPDYLQYYRIRLLKEMGVNAYRTSHNPPTPELLEACDSLGMLVLDETRLLNSGAEYGADWEKQILRDRNHPSVFMWSIGNEEWMIQENNTGKLIARHQLKKQRDLDPSRTATYAANVGNVWHGVNEVIPVRGFNYNLYGLDQYHKEHPEQPVLGSEVASTVSTRGIYEKDTVNAYVPDYDSVAPPWASTAEYWWRIAAGRPWFMGGFAWTGFDYRGEPTPFQWPDINSHFGIMDMCGFPKTVYYYYQSWWTDRDVLHIAPHWNWKGREGRPIAVWVNSNADNVELFLNGKSLGKKDMPRNGHLEWMVNYSPGKIEAVANKKGRTFRAAVETTGQPVRILIQPSKAALKPDGSDAIVYNITVVDRQGREVPDAGNLLHFAVTGAARIIGVGNGNPSSHEPDQYKGRDWQRQLFNGKCQVIVQSVLPSEGAGEPAVERGAGIFTVTGEGLADAEVAIVPVRP